MDMTVFQKGSFDQLIWIVKYKPKGHTPLGSGDMMKLSWAWLIFRCPSWPLTHLEQMYKGDQEKEEGAWRWEWALMHASANDLQQ